jgi:translation initiation factor IF-2
MNLTELARILKISPNELRDYLPQMGFDIGRKAIKIDSQTANKIINQWPDFKKRLEGERLKESSGGNDQQADGDITKKEVKIPPFITVRNFATLTEVPLNKILAELMKNGIFTSLNEKIDFDTAAIIGSDLNLEIKLDEKGENN